MDIKPKLERLQSRSFSLGGVSISFFSLVLISVAVLVALLLLSIHFGWSGLAALIFAIAGAGAALLCFFFDAVKAAFGKGRTVWLGVLALYLHLMAILGFAAPDFFADLGLSRWMALTILFFAVTLGGSYALVSFEKASKIVSLLIIAVTLFSFVPGNSLVRGIKYLGQNVLKKLDHAVYEAASRLEDPEGAIRQKYLDEYHEKVGELERQWKRKELSASEYDRRRRQIDSTYQPYIDKPSSGIQPGHTDGKGITIVGALVTDNISAKGFSGRSEFFASGIKSLYYYVKYRGAGQKGAPLLVRWYHNGEMIQEKSMVPQHEAGEVLDSCRYNFEGGAYEVILAESGKKKSRVTFRVVDRGLVRIDNSVLVPRSAKPGDVLTSTVDYYVQGGSGDDKITVREQRTVKRNGYPVMEPIVRDVNRSSGYNSSTARVYLPSTVPPGDYEVVTIVSSGMKKAKTSSGFSVSRRYSVLPPSPAPSPAPAPLPESYPSADRSGEKKMTLDQLEAVLKKVYRK